MTIYIEKKRYLVITLPKKNNKIPLKSGRDGKAKVCSKGFCSCPVNMSPFNLFKTPHDMDWRGANFVQWSVNG